jgi:hypothetical protein
MRTERILSSCNVSNKNPDPADIIDIKSGMVYSDIVQIKINNIMVFYFSEVLKYAFPKRTSEDGAKRE